MSDGAGSVRTVDLVKYERLDATVAPIVGMLFERYGLADVLVQHVSEVVHDPDLWSITLTGDLVATVNALEARQETDGYTTDRGAGTVGGRTISHADGTFDIVLAADTLVITQRELATIEEAVEHALRAAAHVAAHEAGHVALALRRENSCRFEDLVTVTGAERLWRCHLAAHVDDYRIERMTARTAPSPLAIVAHVEDAIAHFRDELNFSRATWKTDIEQASVRTLTAANGVVRVIAYLAAELGTAGAAAVRPEVLPAGWDLYLADAWDAWSLTFARLSPADEPMNVAAIGAVLNDLCRMAIAWLDSIGVVSRVDEQQNQYIYWLEDSY